MHIKVVFFERLAEAIAHRFLLESHVEGAKVGPRTMCCFMLTSTKTYVNVRSRDYCDNTRRFPGKVMTREEKNKNSSKILLM